MHEGGESRLSVQKVRDKQQGKVHVSKVTFPLEAEESGWLIRQAMDLPKQIPKDCVGWNSGFMDTQNGGAIKDSRNGARCMVVQVLESVPYWRA